MGFPAIAGFRREVTNFHASQLWCSTSRGTGCSVKSWASDKIHNCGWRRIYQRPDLLLFSKECNLLEEGIYTWYVAELNSIHCNEIWTRWKEFVNSCVSDDVARIRYFSRAFVTTYLREVRELCGRIIEVNLLKWTYNMRTWRFPVFNLDCARDICTFKGNEASIIKPRELLAIMRFGCSFFFGFALSRVFSFETLHLIKPT